MVKLNKIYTRTGDDGTTGPRHRRAPAEIGHCASRPMAPSTRPMPASAWRASIRQRTHPEIDAMLGRIQNDLFDLGADLATPESGKPLGYEALRIIAVAGDAHRADIDALNAELEPLKSFVLSGGSPAAAALHLARTVTRRAERHDGGAGAATRPSTSIRRASATSTACRTFSSSPPGSSMTMETPTCYGFPARTAERSRRVAETASHVHPAP